MYEQMECDEVCKKFHTDEKAGLTQKSQGRDNDRPDSKTVK